MAAKVVQGPHRAIKTEFHGPTDHRGSRVIATVLGSGKRVTVSWDHAMGSTENHDAAALKACERMGWDTPYTTKLYGASVAGGGYVYVVV